VKFPEDFAEHAEEDFGIGAAQFEPAKHAAELFFGGGGGAAMDVSADVQCFEQCCRDAIHGFHIRRG
jgi:hypothetical protein